MLLDVRIMMETGWTPQQLAQADEDTVWAIATVMGLDGEKMRDQQRGRPSRPPSSPHSLL